MRLLISKLKGLTELFVLTLLLLVGAGGNAVAGGFTSPSNGFDGGFTGRSQITVEIKANKTSVPVNLAGLAPNPALPYTSTITVAVKQDGHLFPGSISVNTTGNGAQGSLFKEDATSTPLQRAVFDSTDGIALVLFHAGTSPGDVTITASAQDPNTSQTVSASFKITVVGESRPATSMAFTGPYVNAVLAGVSRFGTEEATIQDGSYSRVVSVVVNDADGRPTNPNTQVNFYMIDGPLTPDSYPNNPGAFLVAGNNGVPQVNGLNFNAADSQFLTKGVRPLDRLILDGGQMRTVQTVASETSLAIQSTRPFGADSRSAIPYVIGRAQNATILSPSFTNLNGVADTIVTYPVTRIGQTAILVACTADNSACTALNTCDVNGANCKSVFLGVTNGTDVSLTSSATELGPNTKTPVKLCLKDPNFTPLQATEIRYDMSATGMATVKINDKEGKQGSVMTGADGCATAQIATTGQPPGSKDIVLTFSADNVLTPVQVTVKGPGEGKIDGIASCQITNPGTNTTDPITPPTAACTVDMMVVDDNFSPLSGILITLGDGSADGEITVSFSPAEGNYGKTDEKGAVTASMTFRGAGDYSIPFRILNGTATFTVKFTLPAPTDAPEDTTTSDLKISTTALASATADIFYTALLLAEGGKTPYSWSILSGVLPAGIELGESTGVISGTPSVPGTFNLVIQVVDSAGNTALTNLSLVVASSGGGTGGGAKASSLTLLVSSPDLPSSGQQPVTLTAIARDSKGILLKDASVQFAVKSTDADGTTPNGTIQVISNVTDDSGTATATLSTGGNQRNRIITVGASSGTVNAADVSVNVTGTTLEVSGTNSGTIPLSTADNPNPVKLDFALKNSAGTGIPGATLVVTGAPGGSTSLVTNTSGLAEFQFEFSAPDTYSINATWDSNSANATTTTLPLSLIVSSDSFTIKVTDSKTNPDGSLVNDVVGIDPGFGNVSVEWRRNGGLVPATITLSTNKGSLGVSAGDNPLKTTITSSVPGSSTITATGTPKPPNSEAISPVTSQRVIQFTATDPDTLTLQANPSSIAVNVPPATSSQSTIIATVRDAVGNPVANKDVAFQITQDASGGALSSATAKTDLSGQASVVYVAGSSSTKENGVVVVASLAVPGESCSLFSPEKPNTLCKEVRLTVAKREVFITLGTGNTIEEPNVTTYALPYNVLVNDVVGGAVEGATVTLYTVPTYYFKGYYVWSGKVWVPVITKTCPNEDVNKNSILDSTGDACTFGKFAKEDCNDNKRLDPGNVVTTSSAAVTTDKTGFGSFDVLYAQQYANWISTTLTARTKVGGSEDVEVANFVLSASAADLSSETQSPPGQPSPFGIVPDCATDDAGVAYTLTANPVSLSTSEALLTPVAILPAGGSLVVKLNNVFPGIPISATIQILDTAYSITTQQQPPVVTDDNGETQWNVQVSRVVPLVIPSVDTLKANITFYMGSASVVVPVRVTP